MNIDANIEKKIYAKRDKNETFFTKIETIYINFDICVFTLLFAREYAIYLTKLIQKIAKKAKRSTYKGYFLHLFWSPAEGRMDPSCLSLRAFFIMDLSETVY